MNIGDLRSDELFQRCGGAGLRVKIGPFVFRLHSPIGSFVEDFSCAYSGFPVGEESEVSDFRIRLTPAPRWRPWREPQALFWADGASPFEQFARRIALPWAEWGLNWCIYSYAHQFLIIHSAVVEKAGRAAILAGPSGSGKSTLCAALLAGGWRLLSDEFALLDPARGWLLPIPRPVALKDASINLIGKFLPHTQLTRVFAATRKGRIAYLRPPAEAVERQAAPARPAWVLFPTRSDDAMTELVPLSPAAGFVRLETNCFNYAELGRLAFRALGNLIKAVSCYALPFAQVEAAVELVEGLAQFQPAAGVPV
ncbi:MAG: HprK-related kinase A, partial [Acetobacteraceae bacterium]|nr:HprK-related kinase A [Acetobacteraceae bacterium]